MSEQSKREGPQFRLDNVSGLVWVDDDGQRYKRVWKDGEGPKDMPITAGAGL